MQTRCENLYCGSCTCHWASFPLQPAWQNYGTQSQHEHEFNKAWVPFFIFPLLYFSPSFLLSLTSICFVVFLFLFGHRDFKWSLVNFPMHNFPHNRMQLICLMGICVFRNIFDIDKKNLSIFWDVPIMIIRWYFAGYVLLLSWLV